MSSLQHFAQSILNYIENRGSRPDWFYPYYGLCFNWASYGCYHKHEDPFTLGDAFKQCGLHDKYPFNGDFWKYNNEQEKATLYKNPERLAFLRKLAKGDMQ